MTTVQTYLKQMVNNVVVTSLCVFVFLGCERDFPNPNAPIVDDVSVQSLVTGTEASMRADYAIYLRVVSVVGREAYYFEPADPRYTGELMRATPDPGGFLLNRPWRARYRTVANCRLLLEKAAALTGSAKAGVEGFAKTILAHQLLLNLNYTDTVGIQLDFSGNLSVPFASKTAALAAITQYLDEGYTSLRAAGSTFPFTLSGGFSGFDTPTEFAKFNRALKARVAIYRGNFTDALTALDSSFASTTAPLSRGVYMVYGTGLGDQTNEVYEDPTAPFVKFMAHPTFQSERDSGDTRYSSKIVERATATTFDNLTSNLAAAVVSSDVAPLPVIRNEELILLRAEANIGLSNYGLAESDLNVARTAAGLTGYTGTDASNALDRLLHEKRYSLFLEGHRWVDMRRYNRLGQLPIDRSGDLVLRAMPKPETERP